MRSRHAVVLIALCGLLAASCASEKLIGWSGPKPAWAERPPDPTAADLLFVGQALGLNVLEEPVMRSRAMEDARLQIAGVLGTEVESQSRDRLRKLGYAPRGEDRVVGAEYTREIDLRVKQSVLAVRQTDKYWEKWEIAPGLFSSSFVRYKYFVLAAYPKREYQRNMSYFTRLITDQNRAAALMDAGKAREAVTLLERLLTDYPKASVPIRLKLADACEQAGMLRRAELALSGAKALTADRAQRRRIDERLRQVRSRMPVLKNASAYVSTRFGTVAGKAVAGEPAWLTEPCLQARVAVTGLRTGRQAADEKQLLADARRTKARWLIVLDVTGDPNATVETVYDNPLHGVRAKCSAHVYTAAGELVTATSTSERGLAATLPAAVESACKFAIRSALRECFIRLAAQ